MLARSNSKFSTQGPVFVGWNPNFPQAGHMLQPFEPLSDFQPSKYLNPAWNLGERDRPKWHQGSSETSLALWWCVALWHSSFMLPQIQSNKIHKYSEKTRSHARDVFQYFWGACTMWAAWWSCCFSVLLSILQSLFLLVGRSHQQWAFYHFSWARSTQCIQMKER